MAAGYQNLYLESGSNFSTTITVDDVYMNAYNLLGYSASSQMRKSYYSANATATFSTSIYVPAGTITLSLTAPQTSNISPGRYVYDAVIVDSSNNVTRILEGIVNVAPRVTR
jgi:hypothetical protein